MKTTRDDAEQMADTQRLSEVADTVAAGRRGLDIPWLSGGDKQEKRHDEAQFTPKEIIRKLFVTLDLSCLAV